MLDSFQNLAFTHASRDKDAFLCVGLRSGAEVIPKLRRRDTLNTHFILNIYCHATECVYTGFGLVTGFIGLSYSA
jgi:hypothetical protein